MSATKEVAESKLGAIHEPSGSHEVMVKIGRDSPKALRYHPRSLHGQGMKGGFLQALLPILAEAAVPLLTDLASGLIGNVVGNLTGGQKKGKGMNLEGSGWDRKKFQDSWATSHGAKGKCIWGKNKKEDVKQAFFEDWNAEKKSGRKSDYFFLENHKAKAPKAPIAWQTHVKEFSQDHKKEILKHVLEQKGISESDFRKDSDWLEKYKKIEEQAKKVKKEMADINRDVLKMTSKQAKSTYTKIPTIKVAAKKLRMSDL